MRDVRDVLPPAESVLKELDGSPLFAGLLQEQVVHDGLVPVEQLLVVLRSQPQLVIFVACNSVYQHLELLLLLCFNLLDMDLDFVAQLFFKLFHFFVLQVYSLLLVHLGPDIVFEP